jgi:hypothetical protein
MPVAPKPVPEAADASPLIDAPKIREQLERLLTHPLFANSKRYPALLAYTVEQTLLGNAAELKERSIGVEVFGRSPTYDANADPVVRITAGEVRKRLTQYYYDSSHRGELVIELSIGSYVPSFRAPERSVIEPELAPVTPDPVVESERLPVSSTQSPGGGLRWWRAGSIVILMVLAASAGALSA